MDKPRENRTLRGVALLVHRYVGLVMAAFLIVAGLTGSMMAFYPQLDAVLNPELFVVTPPTPGQKPLDPFAIHQRLRDQLPKRKDRLDGVILQVDPERSLNYWVDDKEVFVDPYTGGILGSRTFGDPREGRKTLLTFFYVLHFSLALGDVGHLLFGIVAVLWTLDCFVGAYLTFPARAKRKVPGGKSWFARWLPMWALKTSKLFSLIFTWHRASGLWTWLMLLIFAWSAVALNLGDYVYRPVMETLFGPHEELHLPDLPRPRMQAKLDLHAAHEVGRKLMAQQARARGFEILNERGLFYEAEHGAYGYGVESSLDIGERLAETSVYFDGDSGELLGFAAPTGVARMNTISSWLIALHFGTLREGGVLYRSFVCLMGLMVTLLSVSGVWIWLRKRKKG